MITLDRQHTKFLRFLIREDVLNLKSTLMVNRILESGYYYSMDKPKLNEWRTMFLYDYKKDLDDLSGLLSNVRL